MVRKGYVDAPTGQVHYRHAGEGVPLLLLHQSPSSSMMFEAIYDRLAARGIHAIGMDTPGFGMSDVPDPRPSIETYAGVIPSLLDALGLESTFLLGHHTGACTAAEFAVTRPDRVRGLILNGPPIFSAEEQATRIAKAHRASIPLERDGSHLIARWNRRVAATPNFTELRAMQRGVTQTFVAGETEWYGHLAAFEHPTLACFEAITVPTLILTNTGDDIYHLAQRAHAIRPDMDYIELTGGTHDIVDEQPDNWAAAVAGWVLGKS